MGPCYVGVVEVRNMELQNVEGVTLTLIGSRFLDPSPTISSAIHFSALSNGGLSKFRQKLVRFVLQSQPAYLAVSADEKV